MGGQETMRRLQAIRRLARQMPLDTAEQRLAKIADVASGEADVTEHFQFNRQDDLAERLQAGIESRAQITVPPPIQPKEEREPEKKRKKRGTRDRQETAGHDRSET